MQEESDDAESPLNIAELEMRIRYAPPDDGVTQSSVIDEITANPSYAKQILPTVCELYGSDRLSVHPSALIRLYLATRDLTLLGIMRSKRVIANTSIDAKIQLFQSGLSDLETDLCEYLWNNWETAGEVWRVFIVQAFSNVGGANAKRMLDVIRYRMADNVNTEQVTLHNNPNFDEADEDLPFRELAANVNEEFLDEVRIAVIRMEARGIK